jgi:hypothetical protein
VCYFVNEGISKIFRTDAVIIIIIINKQTRMKTSHVHPATCNLAHRLTRHCSPTIYRCFALPQLLYRWLHQSGIFWIYLRSLFGVVTRLQVERYGVRISAGVSYVSLPQNDQTGAGAHQTSFLIGRLPGFFSGGKAAGA